MASSPFDANTVMADIFDVFGTNINGKTFVITEARADSYGAQVAMGLAHGRPARLVLLGRSAEPIQSVLDEIRRASPETVSYFVSLNLQDLDSVREAARSIQQLTDAVHGLINCAGLVSREVPSRPPPNGDTERPLASNHVGHFLLTNLLRPQLAAAQGRVCNMSSRKHVVSRPSFEDVKFNNGGTYNGWVAQTASKSNDILFPVALTQSHPAVDALSTTVDPSTSTDGKLFHNSSMLSATSYRANAWDPATQKNMGPMLDHVPLVTVDQAAATIAYASLDPRLGSWRFSTTPLCSPFFMHHLT